METRFTLTDIISIFIWSNFRCNNEYSFSDDRNTLTFMICGTGDSIDYWNETSEEWEEDCVITQGFEPLEVDEDTSELDNGSPMRTHGYKSVCKEITLSLPPNRKRGDTYSEKEVRNMVMDSEFLGDDIPGMGFDYYNLPDDWEDE